MLTLGVAAKDLVTGFEGVITAHCRYLTGCDQYCLLPVAKDGDYKEGRWFDESRIVVVSANVIVLNSGFSNGGEHSDAPPAK